jgi:uncharacterized protein (DUF2147 family)
MKMHSIVTAMAIATAVAAGAQATHGQQQQPPAQLGRWITESGNLEIDIAACGDALCGTVTRVMANRSMSAPGQEMEAVDKRPALGMKILTGLRSSGDEKLTGEIYNRENAKTYSVRLTMDGPQQMLVRPYVGIPLFGKTQLWQRVPAVSMGAEAKP